MSPEQILWPNVEAWGSGRRRKLLVILLVGVVAAVASPCRPSLFSVISSPPNRVAMMDAEMWGAPSPCVVSASKVSEGEGEGLTPFLRADSVAAWKQQSDECHEP